MTPKKNILLGKWEFIGANKHNGSDWKPASFVEGMIWEFLPEYLSDDQTIGRILECAPQREASTSLNYSYSTLDNLLRIEAYTDPQTSILDVTDIYELIEVTKSLAHTTITLSLVNQIGSPAPYLSYTLRQRL